MTAIAFLFPEFQSRKLTRLRLDPFPCFEQRPPLTQRQFLGSGSPERGLEFVEWLQS